MRSTRSRVPAALPATLASAVAAVLTTTVLLPLAPAGATAGDLSVTFAGPNAESGGYPTTSFGWNGGFVTFKDPTPNAGHTYVVSTDPATVKARFDPYDGWDGEGSVLLGGSDDFVIGTTYDVVVSEYDGADLVERSAPRSWTLEAVGHPKRAVLPTRKVHGKQVLVAGTRVQVKWTGAWEPGTHVTNVVFRARRNGAPAKADFLVCAYSYCPGKGDSVVWKKGSDQTLGAFRIPRSYAGSKLVVVSYGTRVDKQDRTTKIQWGWSWTRRVVAPPR